MTDLKPVGGLLAALTILVLSSGAARAQDSLVEQGHDLLERNCSMCHAVGPTGASPDGISPPFREIHRRYPIENLEEALSEGILTGHPRMPQFTFNPDEVKAITAYLKSIQTRQGASLPRAGG